MLGERIRIREMSPLKETANGEQKFTTEKTIGKIELSPHLTYITPKLSLQLGHPQPEHLLSSPPALHESVGKTFSNMRITA